MDGPSTSTGINISDKNFCFVINRLLNDEELSDTEEESEEVDDSDADPDFIIEDETDYESDSSSEDDAVNNMLLNEGQIVRVDRDLPKYVIRRLRKCEFGPGFSWCTKSHANERLRTPAHNIVRGALPGLTAEFRRLGNKPEKNFSV